MKEMSLNVFPRSNDLLAKGGNSLKQIPGGGNTLGIFGTLAHDIVVI
jgi:hypothetical protein